MKNKHTQDNRLSKRARLILLAMTELTSIVLSIYLIIVLHMGSVADNLLIVLISHGLIYGTLVVSIFASGLEEEFKK